MGLIKKNKRKNKVVESISNPLVNVTPLLVKNLVIRMKNGSINLYFKRLQYRGCPKLLAYGAFSKNIKYINMDRDNFVIEMYKLLVNETDAIKENTFKYLTQFVRALDENAMDIVFNEETVMWFFNLQRARVLKGEIKNSTLSCVRQFLAYMLKNLGMSTLSRKLPKLGRAQVALTQTLSDQQLTEISKKLYFGYNAYSKHILNGTEPQICPFYEDYKNKFGVEFDEVKNIRIKVGAVKRITATHWHNNLTRIAYLITSMFTGINSKPLADLKRHNIVFKKGEGDYYELNTIKGRAQYTEQVNAIGFTKRAKEFIDSWMLLSSYFAPKEDDFLFPYKQKNGVVCNIGNNNIDPPHTQMNTILAKYYGLPRITTRIFRKTRSNILMRATNDIFLVASANNHSTSTSGKHYLFGNEDSHNIQLAGAMVAQASIAKGISKKKAISNALFKFKDPISNFDYKSIRGKLPNKTPTGFRCEEPFSKKAKKSLRRYRALTTSVEHTCIDFLGCFECEHHALIAEKDDMWLMLSFRDTVIESINRPSNNSLPSDRLHKILCTTEMILEKYQQIAPDEYQSAISSNKEKSHPLYDDETSLDDLLGVYS